MPEKIRYTQFFRPHSIDIASLTHSVCEENRLKEEDKYISDGKPMYLNGCFMSVFIVDLIGLISLKISHKLSLYIKKNSVRLVLLIKIQASPNASLKMNEETIFPRWYIHRFSRYNDGCPIIYIRRMSVTLSLSFQFEIGDFVF